MERIWWGFPGRGLEAPEFSNCPLFVGFPFRALGGVDSLLPGRDPATPDRQILMIDTCQAIFRHWKRSECWRELYVQNTN